MPGRDGRGPQGMGPMSGRGAGFCGTGGAGNGGRGLRSGAGAGGNRGGRRRGGGPGGAGVRRRTRSGGTDLMEPTQAQPRSNEVPGQTGPDDKTRPLPLSDQLKALELQVASLAGRLERLDSDLSPEGESSK